MKNMMREKVVQQYFIFLTLWVVGHMVTTAIYATYLIENGMSLLQVNLINSVFFFTLFLCEVPSGAFADIFGRKRSIIVACILRGLGEVMYGLSHTVTGFIFSEIFAAIGFTFMNGALKAWFVDSLIHRGYPVPDARIFGRVRFYTQLIGIIFSVIGAYLGSYSLSIPWFLGGAFCLAAAVYAVVVMKEEYFVPEVFSWKRGYHRMKNIAASSIRYAMTDKAVRFILITTFIQIFAVQGFNMYWQPFFGSHGVAKVHYGYIFGGMLLCLAFGCWIASRVQSEGKEKIFIIRSQVFVGALVLLTSFLSNLPLLITFFLLHEVGRGFWEPMRDSYLHKRIPSHERASIDSFCSISPHIGGTFGLVISGAIAEYGGISLCWAIGALVLIIGAFVVAKNGTAED